MSISDMSLKEINNKTHVKKLLLKTQTLFGFTVIEKNKEFNSTIHMSYLQDNLMGCNPMHGVLWCILNTSTKLMMTNN